MNPHPDSREGLARRVAALERQVSQVFGSMELRASFQENQNQKLWREIERLRQLCSASSDTSR